MIIICTVDSTPVISKFWNFTWELRAIIMFFQQMQKYCRRLPLNYFQPHALFHDSNRRTPLSSSALRCLKTTERLNLPLLHLARKIDFGGKFSWTSPFSSMKNILRGKKKQVLHSVQIQVYSSYQVRELTNVTFHRSLPHWKWDWWWFWWLGRERKHLSEQKVLSHGKLE